MNPNINGKLSSSEFEWSLRHNGGLLAPCLLKLFGKSPESYITKWIIIHNARSTKGQTSVDKEREKLLPWAESAHTFSRKTRNGCWNSFKLLLIEEGCIWTSLLPSYQIGWPFTEELLDFLRLLRTAPAMPCSVAATLGYKPAHNIACKSAFRSYV